MFDLNGTMINDMPYHIRAWHRILNELGAGISMERVREECYGKNHELLERVFPGRFSEAEKDGLSLEKEKEYQHHFKSELKLVDGLHDFLMEARKKSIKTAIGSAAILFNIDFVLDGLDIRHTIDAIVSADDVARSKPDPETWLQCMEKLQVQKEDCLVFEDTPKGVESAANAGLDCVVITTLHGPEEFNGLSNIIGFYPNFTQPELYKLIRYE